jgi:hypothetical protein
VACEYLIYKMNNFGNHWFTVYFLPAGLAGCTGAFGAGAFGAGLTSTFGAGFWFAIDFTYLSDSFETNPNGVTGD